MSLNQSKYYNFTKDPQTGNLKILDESHYYPFGLKHQEYSTFGFVSNPIQGVIIAPVANNPYKYKYQGQELQDELGLNWYSFKWRNYMPDIGRFFNHDPLSEKYVYNSPYAFSENRVIDARELEGLEKYLVTGRTFIPNKSVSNPYKSISKTKSFGGDGRNSYKVNTTAYRTEQKVRVDFDNNKVNTVSNKANSTVGYDKNDVQIAESNPDKAGPTPTYNPTKMEDGSVSINMKVEASNKLVSAPEINYDVNISITDTGNGTFDYSISGSRDGFPAYEFFITNEDTGNSYLIYGGNPDELGATEWNLSPPMEVKINASGNSKDLITDEEFEFNTNSIGNGSGGSW